MTGMDITGDDHIIFTFGDYHAAVTNYITKLQIRWPQLSIDLNESDQQQTFSGDNAARECNHAIKGRTQAMLFLYCNDTLRQYHEDNGYTLNSDGIGPFALMIHKRNNIEFQLGKVTEVYSDRDLSVSGVPESYSAWLATPQMIEITLITPTHE